MTQHNQASWYLVGFSFLVLAIAFSARASLGLLMPIWEQELGWSSRFVSSVGASALIVMAAVAPLAGRLIDQRGARFVVCLGLILLSLGCAIVALSTTRWMFILGFAGACAMGFGLLATHVIATAVAQRFDHQQGLATGIATSGATGGQFVVVPLLAALLTFASWRWSFAGLSLASLCLLPGVLVCMPGKGGQSTDRVQASRSSLKHDVNKLLKTPVFHVLFWSFLICGFTTTGVIETHLLPFASYCGFAPIPSATAYGLLSAINLLGMIAAGWLTDRMNRPLLLAAIYFLRAMTFIVLLNLPGADIKSLYLFAVIFGVVDYATIPVTASLVASHLGVKVMGLAMGIIAAGHAIGGAAGAWLGGAFFDRHGSYEWLWVASLAISVAAGLLSLWLPNEASARIDKAVA